MSFLVSFLLSISVPSKVEMMTFEPTTIVARCSPLCMSRKAQRVYRQVTWRISRYGW